MNLNAPHEELALAPLHIIKRNLNRIFGTESWFKFELETISLELGVVLDSLTRDKLNLLQLLEQSITFFLNDVLFFLHSVNVINNNIADFDIFPLPTSLEIAYAHSEIKKLYPEQTLIYSTAIGKVIKYILTLEGYSKALWPFNEMGITDNDLEHGQEEQDTANKEKAIRLYIEAMNNDSNS
jgi:hypothetical protein